MKKTYEVVVDVAYFHGRRLGLGDKLDLTTKQAEHLVRAEQLKLYASPRRAEKG